MMWNLLSPKGATINNLEYIYRISVMDKCESMIRHSTIYSGAEAHCLKFGMVVEFLPVRILVGLAAPSRRQFMAQS
jgi:hypothetical protein